MTKCYRKIFILAFLLGIFLFQSKSFADCIPYTDFVLKNEGTHLNLYYGSDTFIIGDIISVEKDSENPNQLRVVIRYTKRSKFNANILEEFSIQGLLEFCKNDAGGAATFNWLEKETSTKRLY
jgi:hypothetical protein